MKNVYLFVITLALMAGLLPLSMDIYLPSLPHIIHIFHTTPDIAQLTLSLFMVVYAGSQLIVGPLSDQYGRLPVLFWGLGVYIVGCLLCASALSIHGLIIGRIIQAVGGCTGTVLSVAIIRDRYKSNQVTKMMATIHSVTAIAPIIGPVLGGVLDVQFGWRSSFLFLVCMGIVIISMVKFSINETNRYRTPFEIKTLLQRYVEMLRHPTYRLYAGTCLLAFMALFAFVSYAPYLFISVLRHSPDAFGWLFGSNALFFMLGNAVASQLSNRMDRLVLICVGFVMILTGGLCMMLWSWQLLTSTYTVLGPMYIAMVGVAFVLPTSIAGAVIPFPHLAATASALLGFLRFTLGSIVASVLIMFQLKTALPLACVLVLSGVLGLTWIFVTSLARAQETPSFENPAS